MNLLIQEHWLYTCQLHRLKKLHDSYIGVCKAVNSFHPISPVQMPRGYGGVVVLWRKGIDHIINDLPDGGERIQYVELKADRPLLILSVYLPCKGSTYAYNYLEFTDCIDQLNEIMVKYRSTHDILLGGDFNKISSANITRSRRI